MDFEKYVLKKMKKRKLGQEKQSKIDARLWGSIRLLLLFYFCCFEGVVAG